MRREQDTAIEGLMKQWVAHRSEDMASVFARLFDLAMRIDRERFLGAEHYQRTAQWRGYANGAKPNRIDTPTVNVPKSASPAAPFYPQSLERGLRSLRAVMLMVGRDVAQRGFWCR